MHRGKEVVWAAKKMSPASVNANCKRRRWGGWRGGGGKQQFTHDSQTMSKEPSPSFFPPLFLCSPSPVPSIQHFTTWGQVLCGLWTGRGEQRERERSIICKMPHRHERYCTDCDSFFQQKICLWKMANDWNFNAAAWQLLETGLPFLPINKHTPKSKLKTALIAHFL